VNKVLEKIEKRFSVKKFARYLNIFLFSFLIGCSGRLKTNREHLESGVKNVVVAKLPVDKRKVIDEYSSGSIQEIEVSSLQDAYLMAMYYARLYDYQGEYMAAIRELKDGYKIIIPPVIRRNNGLGVLPAENIFQKGDIIVHNHPYVYGSGFYRKYSNGKVKCIIPLSERLPFKNGGIMSTLDMEGNWKMTKKEKEFYTDFVPAPFSPHDLLSFIPQLSKISSEFIIAGPAYLWVLKIIDISKAEFESGKYKNAVREFGDYTRQKTQHSLSRFLDKYRIQYHLFFMEFKGGFVDRQEAQSLANVFNITFRGFGLKIRLVSGLPSN